MSTLSKFSIADREQIKKRVKELDSRSSDIKSRVALTLKQLWNPERELAIVKNLDGFAELRNRFPNFAEVIDLFESSAFGLSRLDLPFETTPVLMLGEPGLGKTLFASELARLLALPFYEVSMSTVSASFVLTGGNTQWAEGSPGFIANSLAESKVGNPIFLIDEIDKAASNSRYSPMSGFYSLLEPHSAKRFKDEALEFEIDASRVIWIATANYPEDIPDPIVSRMRVFDIKRPDETEMQEVIMSIYSGYRNSKAYGQLLDPEINTLTMEALSKQSPRQARISIDQGCLKAIRENRGVILPQDLPKIEREAYRVGFI